MHQARTHWIILLAGFVAAAAALACVPAPKNLKPAPLASVYTSGRHNHVIIDTACWVTGTDAYFDPATEGQIGHRLSHLQGLLNYQIRHAYAGQSLDSFLLVGAYSKVFERHFLTIRDVCAMPGTKSIIYTNLPGGLFAFKEWGANTRMYEALHSVEKEYPFAAPYAREYRAYLENAPRVVASRKRSGITWDYVRNAAAEGARRAAWLGDCAILSCQPREVDDIKMDRLFTKCAAEYANPIVTEAPFWHLPLVEYYWKTPGGVDVGLTWLKLVAAMCRDAGVKFVYYIPPYPPLTQEQYEGEYIPFFVDKVREALAGFDNAHLIDHSMVRDVTPWDVAIMRHDPPGMNIKTGFVFNLMGRMKSSALLLDGMCAEGLVDLPETPPEPLWDFPPFPECGAPEPLFCDLRCG